ncbi:DUF6192 family protein [Streptomyces canus]|uniref:DUF6192 family protein n=1 Tax=Streptomyces canus TaxID=58343 RepID=UPI000379F714|nr:DUF6192 family protein [Streptomyces canus]
MSFTVHRILASVVDEDERWAAIEEAPFNPRTGARQWTPDGAKRVVGQRVSGDETGQELGGAGLPVNPLRRPALGSDFPSLVLRARVFDVQAQHLVGPCGGLVEHLPLRLLRSETSRRHRAAIWFSARAVVRSGGAGRRSMPIVGSPMIQPWRCHHPIAATGKTGGFAPRRAGRSAPVPR